MKIRMFRYRLQTGLILVALAAVALGCLAKQLHVIRMEANAARILQEKGAYIAFEPRDESWIPRFLLPGDPGKVVNIGFDNDKSITDVDLEHILWCPHTRYLHLSDSRISDRGTVFLSQLANLELLDLSDTCISDTGIAHIATLNNLYELKLANLILSTQGIAQLQQLSQLRVLDLSGCTIDGRSGASLPRLKQLNLTGCSFDVALISQLGEFLSLAELALDDTDIEDADIIALRNCPKLELLSLNNTAVRGHKFQELCGLPLIRLELNDTKVDATGFNEILCFTKLRGLLLDNTLITDEALSRISVLSNLQTLSLNGTAVTSQGMKYIGALCNMDGGLFLNRTAVDDSGLKSLRSLRRLELLQISNTPTSEKEVARMRLACPWMVITRKS